MMIMYDDVMMLMINDDDSLFLLQPGGWVIFECLQFIYLNDIDYSVDCR